MFSEVFSLYPRSRPSTSARAHHAANHSLSSVVSVKQAQDDGNGTVGICQRHWTTDGSNIDYATVGDTDVTW